MALTIAIDGPVGSGKTTVARALAQSLGILHLDTGAMYRALALKAAREGIDPQDDTAAEALARRTRIDVEPCEGGQRVFLDGEDVTSLIRTPQVSALASSISTVAAVRARMVALQRRYAEQTDMVLDGRDIGTRVLPDASFKFYLAAPPAVRAKRRYDEERARGLDTTYGQVYSDLLARDLRDTQREADPLRVASGARVIETESMDLHGVVSRLMRIIQEGRA